MDMKPKFRKRYVLGEGYPRARAVKPLWVNALSSTINKKEVLKIDWPEALLWKSNKINYPKYRLELVRVDGKK